MKKHNIKVIDNKKYILLEDIRSTLKIHKAMIKILLRNVEDVRDHIEYRVKKCEEYKDIEGIKKEDLPLHINDYVPGSPEHFLFSCRMTKENPFEKNLGKCLELLYDQEFDTDAYKNLSYNDGMAFTTAALLEIVGMHKEATQATEAVYSYE